MEAVVVAAIIAAIASILTTLINLLDRRKVSETHKQVTQNGGHNNPPTVLDKLGDIKAELRDVKERQIAQDAKFDAHLLWHLNTKD